MGWRLIWVRGVELGVGGRVFGIFTREWAFMMYTAVG